MSNQYAWDGTRDYVVAPTALMIADRSADTETALAALTSTGLRVTGNVCFADGMRELSSPCAVDVIAVECAGQPLDLVDAMLARAAALAGPTARTSVIATVDEAMIDTAAAALTGCRAQLLCRPSPGDRLCALLTARGWSDFRIREAEHGAEASRLQRLSEEVARIAETLARLTRVDDLPPAAMREPDRGYRGPDEEQCDVTATEIRATIRARRMRGQFFSAELFADPAWDMLLDLFAAQLERCRVSVSSLCIAAAVPPTTALRWIGALHDAGLFERQADPFDRRRAYIALSLKGLQGMQAFVNAVKRAGLPLV